MTDAIALPASGAMIEARGLTRLFGSFVAVEHVTMEIQRGEIFGLLGPNGAGKTTLMRMLLGLVSPTEGSGSVAGFDIEREVEAIKEHIGYMAQLFCLYDDLTIGENLEFFGGLHGFTAAALRDRRDWALAMANLTGAEHQIVRDLSLGAKQRLALASAVLHDPPVLILDEPTSGVDPVSRRAFWALLRRLAAQGKTIVLSTHHIEEAEGCGRVALMSDGRVIALDSPAALERSLQGHAVELESDDVLRAAEVAEAAPGVRHAIVFGRRVHIVVDDSENAMKTLPGVMASAGVSLRGIYRVPPSLEDAVLVLLRRAKREEEAKAESRAPSSG